MTTGIAFVRAAKRVREDLGQAYRYAHVVRVARLAERLAFAHGVDTRKARLAGLYHDLARLYSAERLLAECVARAMPIEDFEREHPIVLHARLGAELARERFGVNDEEILSAIRKHTVAAAEMSPLDSIIYLADALEPGRDYPERAAYTAVARCDLAEAMRLVLRSTISYLESRALTVAPQTLAAQSFFLAGGGASVSEQHLEPLGMHESARKVAFYRKASHCLIS